MSANDPKRISHHQATFSSRLIAGHIQVIGAFLDKFFSLMPRLICAKEPSIVPHIENSAPHRIVIFFCDPVGVLRHGMLPPPALQGSSQAPSNEC
jgi:hypothetical protein